MEESYYLKSFKVDKESSTVIFQQVYTYIRQGIVNNNLSLGHRLPSSRNLATIFGVSRNSILTALDILNTEGLISTTLGVGTYITSTLPSINQTINTTSNQFKNTFSSRDRSHTGLFALGNPDTNNFPQKAWARAMKNGISNALNYSHRTGHLKFKQSIVDYIKHFRGIDCSVENIVPLTSAQAGFDIILRSLVKPNATILLEDPCYNSIKLSVKSNHHTPAYIANNSASYNNAPAGNLAYTTPSYQYPTGYIMPTAKRLSLINWASKNNAWILEDDIDSEFYFDHILPPSIYSINSASTLYIGSFSKVLSPSIKVAYIIAPEKIAKKLNIACGVTGQEPSVFMQSAIAQMLQGKDLHLHIRKMRKIYANKQQHLKSAITKHMPFATINKNQSIGLQIPVYFPKSINDTVLMKSLSKQGFSCKALSDYCTNASLNGLHLGYGNMNLDDINNAVEKISNSCKI